MTEKEFKNEVINYLQDNEQFFTIDSANSSYGLLNSRDKEKVGYMEYATSALHYYNESMEFANQPEKMVLDKPQQEKFLAYAADYLKEKRSSEL